ncbi:hypothetical protein PV10_02586 [Exophiala mesophila]|uniref:USP domain-containing protein n=1 Tax=Exophiala mesophila TaxID=212818 RepID=A0A0D1ZJQ7_EXOME|nr:uncharacterized protein PV10_02586 [Exophiala mesophila]KIV94862.1 hypothetical protein PV10_02586 [Exophiala mesophila]
MVQTRRERRAIEAAESGEELAQPAPKKAAPKRKTKGKKAPADVSESETTSTRKTPSPTSTTASTPDHLRLSTPTHSDTRVSFPPAPDYGIARRAAQQEAASVTQKMVPVGFVNDTGNVCFRNSAIVMLLASPRFMSWIQDRYKVCIDKAIAESGPKDYADAFVILYELWQSWSRAGKEANAASPQLIKQRMQDFWTHLQDHQDVGCYSWTADPEDDLADKIGDNQEDPQELLLFIFDVARHVREQYYGRAIPSQQEMVQIQFAERFGCSWCRSQPGKNIRIRDPRLVEDQGWGFAMSESEETVLLEDLIASDVKSVVPGRKCPECGQKADKQEAERDAYNKQNEIKRPPPPTREDYSWKRIWSLPEVLIVQLRRTGFNEDGLCKINTRIDIPEELDLTPHVDETLAGKKSAQYRLRAFVCHRGAPGAGHYIAWAWINNVWYRFNDEKVTKSTLVQARKEQNFKDPFTPYLLLFERVADADEEEPRAPSPEKQSSSKIETAQQTQATIGEREVTPLEELSLQPFPLSTYTNLPEPPASNPSRDKDGDKEGDNDEDDERDEDPEPEKGEGPPPGKAFISVVVEFNGETINFPKYLADDIPGTSENQTLSVTVTVENNDLQKATVSGSGSFPRQWGDLQSKPGGKDAAASKASPKNAMSLKRGAAEEPPHEPQGKRARSA